jgi:hypothetical protein
MEIKIVLEKLKPRKCQFCPQIFGVESQLQMHVSTVHGKNKNFKCDFRNMSFGLNEDLNVNTETVHLITKSHKYPICDKSYGSKNYIHKWSMKRRGLFHVMFAIMQLSSTLF